MNKPSKEERIKLRLQIVPLIYNPEEYYQRPLILKGVDITKLTHEQICLWRTTLNVMQADAIIDCCYEMEETNFDTASNELAKLFERNTGEKGGGFDLFLN